MLALCLKVDNFASEPTLIAADLQMAANTYVLRLPFYLLCALSDHISLYSVNSIFRSLGTSPSKSEVLFYLLVRFFAYAVMCG